MPFLCAGSFEELEQIFRTSNAILAADNPGYQIPGDTLEHERQHVDALGEVARSQGNNVGYYIGLYVARHRLPARIVHKLGKYIVRPITMFPENGLSPLEAASVFGYPDEPSTSDLLQMKRHGFPTIGALGDAVLAYNVEHLDSPLLDHVHINKSGSQNTPTTLKPDVLVDGFPCFVSACREDRLMPLPINRLRYYKLSLWSCMQNRIFAPDKL